MLFQLLVGSAVSSINIVIHSLWTVAAIGLLRAIGAAPAGSDLLYFAFVNYTTLGYGDVLPVKQWLLVGPMAAMNGILMFGWSTAVLFEVLQKTIERQAALAKSP